MTPKPNVDLCPSAPHSVEGATSAVRAGRWPRPAHFLLLAVLAFLPYANALRNGFVYDDALQVVDNPYLRNAHHLHEILASSAWSYMGDFRGATNYYRPVMLLGYLICYRLFGPRALVFHLANLLVNLGVVLIFYLVTRGMFHSEA